MLSTKPSLPAYRLPARVAFGIDCCVATMMHTIDENVITLNNFVVTTFDEIIRNNREKNIT